MPAIGFPSTVNMSLDSDSERSPRAAGSTAQVLMPVTSRFAVIAAAKVSAGEETATKHVDSITKASTTEAKLIGNLPRHLANEVRISKKIARIRHVFHSDWFNYLSGWILLKLDLLLFSPDDIEQITDSYTPKILRFNP